MNNKNVKIRVTNLIKTVPLTFRKAISNFATDYGNNVHI